MFQHNVAIDSGWAWLIPLGGSLGLFFTGTVAWSFSFVIPDLKIALDTSNSVIMVGGGFLISALHLGIGPAWLCVLSSGPRTCFLIGSTLLTFSILVLAMFLRQIIFLICMATAGFGVAFIIYSAIISIENSFNDHLALANSILASGFSLGHILSPHAIVRLIVRYNIRELLFLLFSASLIFFPIGMLMPHKMRRSKQLQGANDTTAPPARPNKSSISRKKNTLFPAFDYFNTKQVTLLIIFLVSKFFTDSAENGMAFVFPIHGKDTLHLTQTLTAWAVSSGGISGFLGRLGLGYMADTFPAWRHYFFIVFVALGGVAGLLALWKIHVTTFFLAYIVYGLSHGAMTGLALTILADFVGHHNFPISVVLEHLVVSAPILLVLYASGKYFDVYNLTELPIILISTMIFIGAAALLISIPIVAGWWTEDQSSSHETENSTVAIITSSPMKSKTTPTIEQSVAED